MLKFFRICPVLSKWQNMTKREQKMRQFFTKALPLTVLTLHRPKNDILPFLKFLQKKVFRLDKKAPAHFYTTLGVVICKNDVARPLHSF